MSSLAGSAAHLLGRVAQLHRDIDARIPGADHHDLLPREGPRALVVPAVQVPALKTLQPCKKRAKPCRVRVASGEVSTWWQGRGARGAYRGRRAAGGARRCGARCTPARRQRHPTAACPRSRSPPPSGPWWRNRGAWTRGTRWSGQGGAGIRISCPPTPCVSPPKVPVSHPEADVPQQVEAPGVHAEVLHDLGVVHVVGEVVGDGEVAEAHHLLGGVDDDGAVDAGAALLGLLLRARGTAQRPAGPGPVQVTAF